MKILLSFIDENDCDPFERKGAILSILINRHFNKVYLLYNKAKYLKPASEIYRYCEQYFPKTQVAYKEALAVNPTDYNTVYPAMYKAVVEIAKENRNADYTISLTSGTPTMHACWIFLQQSGAIPAHLFESKLCGHKQCTVVVRKNPDWSIGDCFLLINKIGVPKFSLVSPGEKSVHWISKYDSITFN